MAGGGTGKVPWDMVTVPVPTFRGEATKREAEFKDQEKIDAAEAKVQWVLEATPPKDKAGMSEQCMARDRAFENAYSCGPKDPAAVPPGDGVPMLEECKISAAQRGCKLLNPQAPSQYYCCTK